MLTVKEVFRGHFDECLDHLKKRLDEKAPKGTRGVRTVKEPIAAFCLVGIEAVHRWLQGHPPKGIAYLRLMCYLDMIGYKVIEMERLKKSRRYFLELIGYGLLSPEKANGLIGYSENKHLYKVLSGKENTSKDKDERMWNAWKERREELEQKKEEASSRDRLDLLPLVSHETNLPARSTGECQQEGAHARYPAAVIKVMEALLAMLEEIGLDRLSSSGWALLIGAERKTILRLSARLSDLSAKLITVDQHKGGG